MKRLTYTILIVITCAAMVIGGALMVLSSSRVQTALIGTITKELSTGLGVETHIDRIKFRFIRTLDLQGVYISDQAGDTLMYVPSLAVAFDPFAIRKNLLRFPKITIEHPYISVSQDSTSTNLDFLLTAFASEDTIRHGLPMPISLEQIQIIGARVRYRHLPSGNDLLLTNIDAALELPLISNDSLSARLVGLGINARLNDMDATLCAEFHGDTDSLFADKLEVTYRNQRLLLGRLEIDHPTRLSLTNIVVECQDLSCNQPLLSCFLSDILHHPIKLPEELNTLGDMHYHGTLSGKMKDLRLHGAFVTKLGTLTTLGSLSMDTTFEDIRFSGKVSTRRFNIGTIASNHALRTIAFEAEAKAHYQKDLPIEAEGALHISSLVFNDYTYTDLQVNGSYAKHIFTGEITTRDPNLMLVAKGKMNFTNAPCANLAIHLKHLRLGHLHMLKDYQDEDLSCRIDVVFQSKGDEGKWIDHMNGYINIDSLYATNYGEEMRMKEFHVQWKSEKDKVSMLLLSDYLNAGISGTYLWSTLPATLQAFTHRIFPGYVPAATAPETPNDLDFYFYFRNLDNLTRVYGTKARILQSPTIKGYIHESDQQYELQCYVPAIEKENASWQHLTFSLIQQEEEASMDFSFLEHTISLDSTKLRLGDIGFRLASIARNDSILTSLRFGNIEANHPDADIRIDTRLDRYNDQPLISVHVRPSLFYLRDTAWTLTDSYIEYCHAETSLSIRNFGMQTRSGLQYLRANGVASTKQDDSIRIDLNNFNLEYFMQYVGLQDALSVKGKASGWATLYTLFTNPMFEANLHVPDAKLNDMPLGNLTAQATLDRETKHILLTANAVENGRTVTHIDGNVIPDEKYWELFIKADSTNISFINFWTEGILEDIQGRVYGDVHVFGKKMNTWVTAKAYAKNAALTLPFTGARYYFSDSVTLDTTYIAFPAIHIRDKEGHLGTIHGKLEHDRFHDFSYNIHGEFTDLLALDIPYSSQAMFYGKAYATGMVDVVGNETMTDINVSASTRGKTDFYLCIATASDAKDNSFISFVDPNAKPKIDEKAIPIAVEPAKFKLALNIEATPSAQVHLTLDPHSGDGIVGRGEGILRLTMDGTSGNVGLYGSYSLLSGTFSYAVANILHRDFTISEGSSISWGGDPLSPTLDVKAIYRLTASLKDLFGSDISLLATNRTNVPVECILNISDKLYNPVLRFGIELPQSDEAISSQVKSIINTDEMLMRQVIYLLVFNRFFTPEYLKNSDSRLNDTYSLLSSTVTGQINSWLSRLTDIVSVGFNFRSEGQGAEASQEYEAQFQIHPISRLSINGNFGYRYNDISNRPFFGDVDIEYQLTPNGKLRARAFTHTVDKYSLKQANMVEGIGLVFRHDFNWGDAKRKREAKKQQKEKEQEKQ